MELALFVVLIAARNFTEILAVPREWKSRAFETDSEGSFITSGIYSVIRQPVYTIYTVEMTAFLLIWFNAVSVAALVLVVRRAPTASRKKRSS